MASGRLVRMQVDRLQFLDADEKQRYEEDCSPFGCPHAGPVILTVGRLRRCQKDRAPHVCISLGVRKSVRVSGAIVGYGRAALLVRRVDTCACVACDEERRGIRIVHGRSRGDPFAAAVGTRLRQVPMRRGAADASGLAAAF